MMVITAVNERLSKGIIMRTANLLSTALMVLAVFVIGCKKDSNPASGEVLSERPEHTSPAHTNTANNKMGTKKEVTMGESFYDFSAVSIDGQTVNMRKYEGKVILVVNTASKCGYTKQYGGLQELHEKYKDRGLAILGFPCNQFGKQEPGSSQEIQEFCRLNYGVTFDMFEKIEVNGESAHPIFKYLKDKLPDGSAKAIKWNFTKFLIDKNGTPVRRLPSSATPQDIEQFIVELL